MSGLDDARVHRADRNFMHPLALDAYERVVIVAQRLRLRCRHAILQRMKIRRPCRVPQPGPPVGIRADGAVQIEDGALHAPGRGKNVPQSRITGRGQRQFGDQHPRIGRERRPYAAGAGSAARPQGEQPAVRRGEIMRSLQPLTGRNSPGAHARGSGQRRRRREPVLERHLTLLRSCAQPPDTTRPDTAE